MISSCQEISSDCVHTLSMKFLASILLFKPDEADATAAAAAAAIAIERAIPLFIPVAASSSFAELLIRP